jgi:thioesterase domain-containing protein
MLARLLGDGRPVYGLQPPGADDRSEILYSVEALAARYISEVREVQPHGPYFLGGYSGGGVAAFEMARQLTASGDDVAFLGFLDSFSPALPQRSMRARLGIHVARMRKQGVGYTLDTLRRRITYDRATVGMSVRHALGALFHARYRYETIQKSWMIAEQSYRPGRWDGHATLFRAREESALSLWTAFEVDREHGWTRYVTGGVTVELCPGNHATMCEEPNVRVLAQKLRAAMDGVAAPAEAYSSPAVAESRAAR